MSSKRFDRAGARCQGCGIQFSRLNLAVNLALAIIKGFIGSLARSRALMVGALYSVNDVLSAIVVIISMRVARRPADDTHPYGHGMAEFVAVGVVSVILLLAIVAILVYSVIDVVNGVEHAPHMIAILVAMVTMGTNEFLARRGFCVAERLGSPALLTSAEHNRADAVSSLLTIVGVSGAAMGLHVLDPLVAIVEALHIVWLSGTLLGHSVRGLMDGALPVDDQHKIVAAAAAVTGVEAVTRLRSRQVGPLTWVDVEVQVFGTLDDAASVVQRVQQAIRSALRRSVQIQVKLSAAAATVPAVPNGEVEAHA